MSFSEWIISRTGGQTVYSILYSIPPTSLSKKYVVIKFAIQANSIQLTVTETKACISRRTENDAHHTIVSVMH